MCTTEIKCNKCGDLKAPSYFSKNSKSSNGLSKVCKLCRNKEMQDYRKTKRGRLVQAYQDQLKNSKKRGHTPPEYSLEEFVSFGLSDINFNLLHKSWADKGYQLEDTPSPDRLDDGLPYTFDNLQFTTFKYNNQKAHKASTDCKYTFNREVVQLSLLGEYINTFESIAKASRYIKNKGIRDCVTGRCKTAGGYKWKDYRTYLLELLNEIGNTPQTSKDKIHYSHVHFNENTCLISVQ